MTVKRKTKTGQYRDLSQLTQPIVDGLITGFINILTSIKAKPQSHTRSPYEVVGVSPAASEDEIKAVYKLKAKYAHPDMGGSDERMSELNQAFDAIKKERGFA